MSSARRLRTAVAVAVTVMASAAASCSTESDGNDDDNSQRQEEVAERGAGVMPFDLDATTHRFDNLPNGITQQVVADDPEDQTQIKLIRQHLKKEAGRFQSGDFSDPTAIHGKDMPGVQQLSKGADQITIRYSPLDNGSQLTFRTSSADLVDALHDWADAQVSDHGSHASHD